MSGLQGVSRCDVGGDVSSSRRASSSRSHSNKHKCDCGCRKMNCWESNSSFVSCRASAGEIAASKKLDAQSRSNAVWQGVTHIQHNEGHTTAVFKHNPYST
jgi:hypothetical protein